jgi:radical SAM protein with 4Fe4S-binding SPASM domain
MGLNINGPGLNYKSKCRLHPCLINRILATSIGQFKECYLNELLLSRLLLSLSPRRVGNIIKTSASFILSALTRRNIVWGMPPVLTIEPTNLCNLKCPLCTTGSGEMERVGGRMSLDTFERVMDLFGRDIFFLLIYHQGEPYINKHFSDFVRMAKQRRIYVTTSTNGHYFTAKTIHETITSGLDSMIVSIDGTTQASYARYRVGGTLEKVLSGTRALMAERKRVGSRTPNVALQFLVMKHNEHEIPQMKRLAAELGVDRLLIKNIEVRSAEEAKTWLPVTDAFRRYHFDGAHLVVKNSDKESCTRPWLSTLINWDGSVVPCCFDKNGKYTMGNINRQPISEIWNGDDFQEFRRKLVTNRRNIDICRNCNQGFGSFLPKNRWRRNTSTSEASKV